MRNLKECLWVDFFIYLVIEINMIPDEEFASDWDQSVFASLGRRHAKLEMTAGESDLRLRNLKNLRVIKCR